MTRLEKIRAFFLSGLWSSKRVEDAAKKGFITEAEKDAILRERREA